MSPQVDGDGREQTRVAELRAYEILDTVAEATFDAIAAAAAEVAGVESAGIGLIDGDREWFKAALNMGVTELPRKATFCNQVVADRAPVVVDDTHRDPRFAHLTTVAPTDGVRFYAGFPLTTPTGSVLGSLCVLGPEPRVLEPGQRRILQTLADQAMTQIELLHTVTSLRRSRQDELRRTALLEAVLESIDVGIVACDADGLVIAENDFNIELVGLTLAELSTLPPAERAGRIPMLRPDGEPIAGADRPLSRVLRGEPVADGEITIALPDRPERRVLVRGRSLQSPAGEHLGSMVVLHDVTSVRAHAAELAARMRDVERLADFSRTILSGQDAASTACEAVQAMCSAQQVSVLVPGQEGGLVVAASTEPSLDGLPVPIDPESAIGRAYDERVPVRVDDMERTALSPALDLIEAKHGRVRGALYVPLVHDGECCGVLALTTSTRLRDIPDRVFGLLDILTAELSTSLDRDRLRRQLTEQASTDPLTGLANRRTWDRHLAAHLADAAPVCLAVLDLDHFKTYNDTYGHPAGDALLATAAAAWAGSIRVGDMVARLGGEEFGVLLPGCTLADATSVVNTLRALVPDAQTASAGLAQLRAGESAEAWFSRADRALYRAKHAGRDQLSDRGDVLVEEVHEPRHAPVVPVVPVAVPAQTHAPLVG